MTKSNLPKNELSSEKKSNEKELSQEKLNSNKTLEKDSSKDVDEFIKVSLKDLYSKKELLEKELEQLSNRKSKLEKEFKSTFSGQSDDITRKVKGFQEYLTGALQNLATSVEQLDLIIPPVIVKPSPLDIQKQSNQEVQKEDLPAIADTFKPDEDLIRSCFDQFLGQPDFYAEPWKFRRSLLEEDIALLEDWFFSMGGRGAQPSRGNRSKNVLVSAALISILGELYGDRFQTLILASQPERLGEWRRGLQDALGLNREDFGPHSGIVLFERADGLIERADRLEEKGDLPLILIDASENSVDIPILQFPIWLAFSSSAEEIYAEEELFL